MIKFKNLTKEQAKGLKDQLVINEEKQRLISNLTEDGISEQSAVDIVNEAADDCDQCFYDRLRYKYL